MGERQPAECCGTCKHYEHTGEIKTPGGTYTGRCKLRNKIGQNTDDFTNHTSWCENWKEPIAVTDTTIPTDGEQPVDNSFAEALLNGEKQRAENALPEAAAGSLVVEELEQLVKELDRTIAEETTNLMHAQGMIDGMKAVRAGVSERLDALRRN